MLLYSAVLRQFCEPNTTINHESARRAIAICRWGLVYSKVLWQITALLGAHVSGSKEPAIFCFSWHKMHKKYLIKHKQINKLWEVKTSIMCSVEMCFTLMIKVPLDANLGTPVDRDSLPHIHIGWLSFGGLPSDFGSKYGVQMYESSKAKIICSNNILSAMAAAPAPT